MEKVNHLTRINTQGCISEGESGNKAEKGSVREFSRAEEVAHSLTHGAGAVFGIVGLILMIVKAVPSGAAAVIGAAVFGAALIILYSASCAYHTSCAVFGSLAPSRIRDICMKCDHSLIYILILGTYTPACISAMGGAVGYTVFGVVFACCAVGITLNVINVERFMKVSLALYVIAGWTIALAIKPYYDAIGMRGIIFLVLGGIAYTVGIFFYKAKQTKYMHIIWHLFVLLGSVLHFLMVYLYCI